ncbi:RNA-directed DNA polymerase, eukaryota [Tanacetum coccineum]|uniref:RNA-directed DNA polymerase, eukaryota n=1 Tax=Tanacetum coccineum TaxID=301880 RepID=A0ABQ5B9W5_9ASTR
MEDDVIDLFSVRRCWAYVTFEHLIVFGYLDLMIVAVYAPHDPSDKRMLWDYLAHVINQWQGEVVIMGDFNEMKLESGEYGYIFGGLCHVDFIDEICLPNIGEETRWVKCVPIKINVLAWKIKTDALPTRFNISRRGIDIQDMSCPICDNAIESTDHLFFRCGLVRDIANKVLSWWNLDQLT